MKFIKMKKPLAFDVKCRSKVVIPAGARGVEIAFRASHLQRYDDDYGDWIPLNVYRYRGVIYHA